MTINFHPNHFQGTWWRMPGFSPFRKQQLLPWGHPPLWFWNRQSSCGTAFTSNSVACNTRLMMLSWWTSCNKDCRSVLHWLWGTNGARRPTSSSNSLESIWMVGNDQIYHERIVDLTIKSQLTAFLESAQCARVCRSLKQTFVSFKLKILNFQTPNQPNINRTPH